MSWNDSDIDQLFKGAKAPEPPPFEEAFWTEMEALLPVQKRRKGAFWWISGGAAGLLLLGGLLFWMHSGNESAVAVKPVATAAPSFTPPVQYPFTESSDDLSETTAGNQEHELKMENRSADRQDGKWKKAGIDSQRLGSGKQSASVDHSTTASPNAPIIPKNTASTHDSPSTIEHSTFDIQHSTSSIDHSTFPIPDALPRMNAFVATQPGAAVSRTLPDAHFPKPERFYLQASAGIGQSGQRNVPAASDLLHYYAVGGGLFKRVDGMILTFGLTGRVDFTRNVVNSQTDPLATTHRIDTRYSQLYSVETPVSIGFNFGRNTFGATLTPGFQTGFTGQQSEYQDQQLVRSGNVAGKVQNSKTLTMEVGVNYWRTVQPNWYLGAAFNVDAIRPFNAGTFNGQQRLLPVNGQIILRRTF